jgi:aspartyl-tRNA(Asn)/glutamyl-tRNA(Gln) amidotransferase subunit A
MRDCGMLLQAIAGFDALDPASANVQVPDFCGALDGSLRGVRIGIPRAYFFDQPELNAEVRQAVVDAVDALARAGADVRDVSLSTVPLTRIVQRTIMLSEAYAYHQADLSRQPHNYGKYTRAQILLGCLYSGADYVQAQRLRSVVVDDVRRAMADLDVLVMPMSLSVASTFEAYDPDGLRRSPNFSSIWNVTGQPAASICCGFSSTGLPIGLQIVGKAFDEATVLRVGDAYQRLTDWHTRTPAETPEVQPA